MKAATEYLWFNTRTKRDYINITSKVQEIVTCERHPRRHGARLGHAHHRGCVCE